MKLFLRVFGLTSKNELLSLSDFLIGVGQLKFRGTSLLFRLNRSLNDLLNAVYDSMPSSASPLAQTDVQNGIGPSGDYDLAIHTIKVKRSGIVADISTLWELEGATTPLLPTNKPATDMMAMFEELSKPQFGRIQSIDVFNQVFSLV